MKDEVSILEFTEKFPDEQSCIDFLKETLFPNGEVTSPFVEGGQSYEIRTRPGVYKCKKTRKTFSIRKGTIFEESRLPLRKWFFAIFLMHSLKKRHFERPACQDRRRHTENSLVYDASHQVCCSA